MGQDRDPQGARRPRPGRGGASCSRSAWWTSTTVREWECFDADSGKDLGEEIREYLIPDFSNWKDHDSFETAFGRLIKDLKATTSTDEKTA